jgi:hypothetical protein
MVKMLWPIGPDGASALGGLINASPIWNRLPAHQRRPTVERKARTQSESTASDGTAGHVAELAPAIPNPQVCRNAARYMLTKNSDGTSY